MSAFLKTIVALAVLAGAGPAWSQSKVPDQKITGADAVVPLGDIVVLGVTPPEGAAPAGTSYTWEVLDPSWEWKPFKDLEGGGIVFGSGIAPKTFKVFCAATYLFVDKDGEKVTDIRTKTVILHADVQVGGGPAPPPPKPDSPTDRFGLTRAASEMAAGLPADVRTKLCRSFAKNYRGVAAAIAAGGVVGQNAALRETTTLNQASIAELGVARDQVMGFFSKLQVAVYGLAVKQSEKPGEGLVWAWTDDDFRVAWLEIATGLEGVR